MIKGKLFTQWCERNIDQIIKKTRRGAGKNINQTFRHSFKNFDHFGHM